MPRCPFCSIGNNWVQCPNCGDVRCGSCHRNSGGTKSSAANKCPSCGKNGPVKHVSAPYWAK